MRLAVNQLGKHFDLTNQMLAHTTSMYVLGYECQTAFLKLDMEDSVEKISHE